MREHIGSFELMVLLTVIRLGDNAYGVPISEELENEIGREVAIGSVYAALERLEQKRFVKSELGEPTAERGGPGEAVLPGNGARRKRSSSDETYIAQAMAGPAGTRRGKGMNSSQTPRLAEWLLSNFGCSTNNGAIIGDINQRYQGGPVASLVLETGFHCPRCGTF